MSIFASITRKLPIKSNNKLAILSPHLDDAVLSCCDFILDSKKMNVSCTIFTIFSRFNTRKPPVYSQQYMKNCNAKNNVEFEKMRKNEDELAMRKMNVKYSFFDLTDGGFRKIKNKPLYPTFSSLFSGNLAVKDQATTNQIIRKLDAIKNRFDYFLVPYGLGNHADHLITKIAAQYSLPSNKILYYVEMPYGLKISNWNFKHLFRVLKNTKTITLLTPRKRSILNLYRSQTPLLFGQKNPTFVEIIFS